MQQQTDVAQFSADLDALVINSTARVEAIDRAGRALQHEHHLLGCLSSAIERTRLARFDVLQQLTLPDLTPADIAKRAELEADITATVKAISSRFNS